MSTYFDHLAAAREVQIAMQLSREQLVANHSLLAPSELLGTGFTASETAAAALARRAISQLSTHGEFWQTRNPAAPEETGERATTSPLFYGIGRKAPLTSLLARPGIIITGPRRPAERTTIDISRAAAELASSGVPLIAGLSNGIEVTALQVYLQVAPELVTLILGSSPLLAYPINQRDLHKRAVDSGCAVISRVPHPAAPIRHSEHLRNLTRIPLASAAVIAETRPEPSATSAFIKTATAQHLPLFACSPNRDVPAAHRPALAQWQNPDALAELRRR